MTMREEARTIIDASLAACLPDEAVRRALQGREFGGGKLLLVAVGKAAWQMAACCAQELGDRLHQGVVITKYGHSQGPISCCAVYEAGHPVPDENGFAATRAAMALVTGLSPEDTVIFLVSGGGSALLEAPLIPGEELRDLTDQMLASGADIVEMNTLRKRLSAVKGGRFAQLCAPAKVFSVVLSDIVGDPLDMIASGPACPDSSTCAQALEIVQRYGFRLSDRARTLLGQETPKALANVETAITGSVRELCRAAAKAAEGLGYRTEILTDSLTCQAREAGAWLADLALQRRGEAPLALIAGGETVVLLTGSGKGGRNQELALAAAEVLRETKDVVAFSVGSDGTDGPTDAAGGIVDGHTAGRLEALGLTIPQILQDNNAYPALGAVDGLIFTGPTGTNVNDVAVVLMR